MTDRLEQQLQFLREIDGLKSIVRASPLLNQSRKENSAEHSWHLALYALILAEHAAPDVDVVRVVKMLLIHDIVEIDAGDVPINSDHDPEQQAALEREAADRIFALLPPDQAKSFRQLWDEFEAAQSSDATFAKSLDRMQPLIHNVETGGGTWTDYDVSERQVVERYGPQIERGSSVLWDRTHAMVRNFFARSRR